MTAGRKPPIGAANELSVLLRTVLGEERFPIDVGALAVEYSKNFQDPITKIKGVEIDGFEGMLRASRKRPSWQILYNTNTNYPGRERFTLAHEFGHYVMHRRELTAASYQQNGLSGDFDFECLPLQANRWRDFEKEREEEADTFASYLLMPIDDYRRQVSGSDMTRALLNHITRRYGVSLLAAVRKWIEFTDRRAAMVVARDGFACWGRASAGAAKSGIFVRTGMPIPELSIAARGPAAVDGMIDAPLAHPVGVWTFHRGSEPVRELTVFSERLGLAVSILLFEDDAPATDLEEPEAWDTFDQFERDRQV